MFLQAKFPVNRDTEQKEINTLMTFCLAYQEDLEQAYAFYCARYQNIEYNQFLELGYNTFIMKIGSMPESEPLFDIIKSRTIKINKIKDKDERKYWREMKKNNAIPDIFKTNEELNIEIKKSIKENVGGIKWKRI